MRNRAKCRLCNDIIESKHRHDYVSCSCREISVDGGSDYHRACFKNRENFICIDDEGNEFSPAHEYDKKDPIPIEQVEKYIESVLSSPEKLRS